MVPNTTFSSNETFVVTPPCLFEFMEAAQDSISTTELHEESPKTSISAEKMPEHLEEIEIAPNPFSDESNDDEYKHDMEWSSDTRYLENYPENLMIIRFFLMKSEK